MFTDSARLDQQQVTATLNEGLDHLAKTEDTWFNGSTYMASIESVDRRIEGHKKLINAAKRAAGRHMNEDYLEVLAGLEEGYRGLVALRADLLDGASGRQETNVLASQRPTKLPRKEARWVDLEAKAFVYREACSDRNEMYHRASRWVNNETGQMSEQVAARIRTAFVSRVDEIVRRIPRAPKVAAKVFDDFEDALIFTE